MSSLCDLKISAGPSGLICLPERQGEECTSAWSTLFPWPSQEGPKLTSRSEAGDPVYSNQQLFLPVLTSSKNSIASARPKRPPNHHCFPNLKESGGGEGGLLGPSPQLN